MKFYVAVGVLLGLTGLIGGLFLVRAQQRSAQVALAEARAASEASERQRVAAGAGPVAVARDTAIEELRREVASLRTSIEDLRAELGRGPRRALDEPVEPPDSTSAVGISSRELARLEASMRSGFDELRALIELGERHALVDAIRSDKRHIDWTAWEEVIAAWRRDPKEARQMIKLLTSDELIDRFGPPTDVWANQMGLTWQYKRDHPVEAGLTQEIILRLPDGFVAQLAVRELRKDGG